MVRRTLLALQVWLALAGASSAMTMIAVADNLRKHLHVTLTGPIVAGEARQLVALVDPYRCP